MADAHRRHKDTVYEQLAKVGKALASPKRLELLDLLSQAPRTIEDLAEQAGLSIGNASQHLKLLREAGLVEGEKRGLYVTCRLAGDDVAGFLVAMRGLAESHLAELPLAVRRVLGGRRPAEPVDGPELVMRVRRGEVVVLDVRPPEEYRAGHVPGARSIPLPELAARLSELPTDAPIVAYCRGPYCVYAADAVELLRRHGYDAMRMDQGVVDWRSQGWPIETCEETHP
ncbi:metalloregulator ArsR/SmtB family transcription factor [Nannocystis sp. ILAH1]|uniref:ArsR/SmtB family transcription factor n=1 Tax=Nannocystis sp. ILAH1 TaxID=2996789 RepID=UPI00226EBB96|nr:metalloregulator ArsR/SmtB family transcription factor [Nannocystis sp. ILAH1]